MKLNYVSYRVFSIVKIPTQFPVMVLKKLVTKEKLPSFLSLAVKKNTEFCFHSNIFPRKLDKENWTVATIRATPNLQTFTFFLRVAGPGCLSRIRIFGIPDPGYRILIFSIPDSGPASKSFKYFNPKNGFLSARKYDPGCSMFIPDPDHDFLLIPDPRQKGTVSRIRIRNTVFSLAKVSVLVLVDG